MRVRYAYNSHSYTSKDNEMVKYTNILSQYMLKSTNQFLV